MPKKKDHSSWICRHLKIVQSLKMSGSDYPLTQSCSRVIKSLGTVLQRPQNLHAGILKSHKDSNHSLSVPYSGRKIKRALQSEMALSCLWGYVPHCSAPYSTGKEGALQSEMALTCLWVYVLLAVLHIQ